MKNRLMILALAVTVLATVLLGCAKQEENPTTERNHHTRGNHGKKSRRGTERGRIGGRLQGA